MHQYSCNLIDNPSIKEGLRLFVLKSTTMWYWGMQTCCKQYAVYGLPYLNKSTTYHMVKGCDKHVQLPHRAHQTRCSAKWDSDPKPKSKLTHSKSSQNWYKYHSVFVPNLQCKTSKFRRMDKQKKRKAKSKARSKHVSTKEKNNNKK